MTHQRSQSVDALRGFDMFWIVGGDFIVHSLAAATSLPVLGQISAQLRHTAWAGVTAYDLVLPLFMFLAGVSLSLVLERVSQEQRSKVIADTAKRAVWLLILGVFYNWGWEISFSTLRVASVLGLIGVTGFFTACIMVFFASTRACIAIVVLIIGLSTLAQLSLGDLSAAGSLNAWLDQRVLPGRLYGGSYDPEGVFSAFSATSITLSGAIAGQHLMRAHIRKRVCTTWPLFTSAAACLVVGALVWPYYPPIKQLCTGTFDIISIGACLCLLGIFIIVFDRFRIRAAATFWTVIGSNALLAYLGARYALYPVYKIAADSNWPALASAVLVAGLMASAWLGLFYLYRQQIFLRL